MTQKKQVLFICHSADGRMYLGLLLKRIGYASLLVGTAEEGVRLALLVGQGAIPGYDSSVKSLDEWTPVQMIAAYFGLFFGVIIYTTIFYLLLNRAWRNKLLRVDA